MFKRDRCLFRPRRLFLSEARSDSDCEQSSFESAYIIHLQFESSLAAMKYEVKCGYPLYLKGLLLACGKSNAIVTMTRRHDDLARTIGEGTNANNSNK